MRVALECQAVGPLATIVASIMQANLLEVESLRINGIDIAVQYLVPSELEQKLAFLLSKVPHGTHHYYLNWLKERLDPERNLQECEANSEMIRHVVVNIHPSNETIFETDVIKRFILIEKLLVPTSKSLNAVLFDLLSYNPSLPHSVMLVEPAILLMYRSCESNPQMTERLINFLSKLAHEKFVGESVWRSVQGVLIDCEHKGVVRSIRNMIGCQRLSNEVR